MRKHLKNKNTTYKDFIPEKSIKMNKESSIDQISARYQSVYDGLPELIKNSKDQYSRLKVLDKKERQIVVIISTDKTKLGVLDFAGAKLKDFKKWEIWSERTSAEIKSSTDIEAGFGNGGKSFMARGCEVKSSLCSYSNEKVNKFGFINNNKLLKYRRVTFTDADKNKLLDHKESDFIYVLNEELKPFNITINDLPKECIKILKKRKAFTFTKLENVNGWVGKSSSLQNRVINKIPNDLTVHDQATWSIESCSIWIQNGKNLLIKNPLKISELTPYEGLETIDPIPIPNVLEDPDTGEQVKINSSDKFNRLELRTSNKNLRAFGHKKARNVIRIKDTTNVIATWSVADLVASYSSGHVYGYLFCSFLDESFLAGSDRKDLIDHPIVRALKHWVAKETTKIVKNIQILESKRDPKEDRTASSETLKELRDLMKKYLTNTVDTEGGSGKKTGPSKPEILFGERVDEIVLEPTISTLNIVNGTTIPVIVKCYQRNEDKRIPVQNAPLILCAETIDIIEQEGNTSIKAISTGTTKIFFETQDRKIQSNFVVVKSFDIDKLDLDVPKKILKQGEKVRLDVKPYYKNKIIPEDLFYETHIDESDMGRLTRSCLFTAGYNEGKANVRIRYGSKDSHVLVFPIEIGNEKVEKSKKTDNLGVPHILLCGDIPPGNEELPEEDQTHHGGPEYPTLIDFLPEWENVIWINDKSQESMKVRQSGKGFSLLLKVSSQTFREFLALKCFEILKRLKVKEQIGDNPTTTVEFFNEMATAEVQISGFLESAYDVVKKLVENK